MRDPLICHNEIRRERHGAHVVYLTPGVEAHEVLGALESGGDVLKEGRKGSVRRFGHWVVKTSEEGFLSTLKRTLQRRHYRKAWIAAHHLRQHGVLVPTPVAFVERRRLGVISAQAMISGFLEGQRDVEDFAVGLCRRGAGHDTLTLFLEALAAAIRRLEAAGAYHADLSGKNIFTRDGAQFTFIDLDAVQLGQPYSEARRLKNHAQLYDSFCDFIHERLLVPFMQKLLPPEIEFRDWMPDVRYVQQKRRHKLELRYARRGEVRPKRFEMPED